MSLIDAVMSELDAGHVRGVAQRLGIPEEQARGAIEHALPLLVGAMARQSATPDGAQALHGALDAHAGLDVGGLLAACLAAATAAGWPMCWAVCLAVAAPRPPAAWAT